MSHDTSDIRRELRLARNARVLALHREGLPNTVIAQRMGLLPGRVDEIVTAAGLRGNKLKREEA